MGPLARGIGWLLLTVILALGGAGLAGQLSHPPGDDRRAELTWSADATLAAQLDDLSGRLADVGNQIDGLAASARTALLAVSSEDDAALATALDQGAQQAGAIDAAIAALRSSVADLPGGDAAAATRYTNGVLVRRAAVVAAIQAVGGLSDGWAAVAARSTDAAALMRTIRAHDSTLAAAAAAGVQAHYGDAIDQCNQAIVLLGEISTMRTRIVQAGETVLDDWISRNQAHDAALLALYQALQASGGKRNPDVDAAYRAEQLALAALPSDNRAIIVIVSEVSQGGLNQAVIAIEDARGRIDDAIAAVPSD
jgi:hypothetical protein